MNVPRSSRVQALYRYAAGNEVSLLYFDNTATNFQMSGIAIKIPDFYRFTLFRDFCKSRSKYFLINKIVGLLVRLISQFIKVDKWEVLRQNILRSIDINEYTHIVISVAPFSNYSLSTKLKSAGFSGKVILDIGDPLSYNAALDAGLKVNLTDYETSGISAADALIVTNYKTASYFKDNLKFRKNVLVLPNGFHNNGNMFPQAVNINYDIIKGVYAGALYETLRPINPLLKAFQRLGDMAEVNVISSQMPSVKSDNIKWTERVSQEALIDYYNSANLLLYIDNNAGIQTSSKIFELIALGKPVLFLYNFESENFIFAKNFPWVHFVLNDEECIYLHLIEKLVRKTVNYSPDYRMVKKYEWKESGKIYYEFMRELIM